MWEPPIPEAPPEAAVTMTDLHKSERVGFADAEALANLTAYLATKKKPYRLRLQEDGQLNELKEGPAVLIGAFSNSFTLRLTGPTRFNFVRLADSHQVGIRDRQHPQNMAWFRSPDVHYTDVKEDYAICVAGLGLHHRSGGRDGGRSEQVRNGCSRRISQYAELCRTDHAKRAKGLGSQEYRVGHRDQRRGEDVGTSAHSRGTFLVTPRTFRDV